LKGSGASGLIDDMHKTLVADACDCHVHVVGTTDRFPQASPGSYNAAPATVESLRATAEPLGVSRFVIVQPSFYGTDNSCLFESLDQLGDSGRGVAVVDARSTSASILESYGRRGIRGLRLNFYSSPVTDVKRKLERSLSETLDILPREHWHVEIIARGGTLSAAAPMLAGAKVPIVIDHYGLPEDEGPESPAGRALLELISLPHVWIKLSAPYRCSTDPLATSPPSEWMTALVQTAPDDLVDAACGGVGCGVVRDVAVVAALLVFGLVDEVVEHRRRKRDPGKIICRRTAKFPTSGCSMIFLAHCPRRNRRIVL